METRVCEVHVIFDGPPGLEAGRFVEVENERGEGMRLGEWRGPDEDGLWHLVVSGLLTDEERKAVLEQLVGYSPAADDDIGPLADAIRKLERPEIFSLDAA